MSRRTPCQCQVGGACYHHGNHKTLPEGLLVAEFSLLLSQFCLHDALSDVGPGDRHSGSIATDPVTGGPRSCLSSWPLSERGEGKVRGQLRRLHIGLSGREKREEKDCWQSWIIIHAVIQQGQNDILLGDH